MSTGQTSSEEGKPNSEFPGWQAFDHEQARRMRGEPVQSGSQLPPNSVSQPKQHMNGEDTKPTMRTISMTILGIFAATALVVWTLGAFSSFGWSSFHLPLFSPPSINLIQSSADVVIMSETGNGYSRVLVRKANSPGWLLVSTDDLNAHMPSLSPDSALVAYLSTTDGGVVITSLEEDHRLIILPQMIDGKSLRPIPVEKFELCPWTNIAWSPNSQRISFFVCSAEPTRSYVATVDSVVVGVPVVIPESYVSSEDTREVMWLTANRIIVNRLATSGPSTIDTDEFTVP